MPFFFRIIAKNSKCDELPEVALRRSPTTTLPNIADDAALVKKKSVSFKEDVESIEAKPESRDGKAGSGVSKLRDEHNRKPSDYPPNAPRIETIKLKLDVSNNNVSIIKNTDSTPKHDKNKQRSEKKEKKNKLENLLPKYSIDNEKSRSKDAKKDEYEFDDDIDQQKLGFLNTFQLTAKKILEAKANTAGPKSDCTPTTNNKNNLSPKSSENNVNKRKSKEPVKSAPKKYKFHEMGEGNKFLFTKTGDGHEITFDMSLKPLGSKPPLSKVKSDIMLAQQRADDAKANKEMSKTDNRAPTIVEQPPTDKPNIQQRNVPIKPKKLPMLLPKQPARDIAPNVAAASAISPTAFVIKKPEAKKEFTSEISVTKINDQNPNLRVYGPKSPVKTPVKDSVAVAPQFKTPDGFTQPLPPKSKANLAPTIHTPNILKPYGYPIKMPKNIPENMQTPYGCRTPFYVPSSPSYTPNFDPKPQFKYANPNAYASFMQSMFCANPNQGKISPPINNISSPKSSNEAPRKRPSTDNVQSGPMKRKSPSPTKTAEPDSKAISILNKINFPSSLSVTLTNEQEENKKEQLRSQKQSIVNNNIEIIKISEEKDAKAIQALLAKASNTSPTDKKIASDKKTSDVKKLSPILPALVPNPNALLNPNQLLSPPVAKALTESKESFQRAFLESLMSVTAKQNIDKNSVGRKKEAGKPTSTEASGRDDKDKNLSEIKTEDNAGGEKSSPGSKATLKSSDIKKSPSQAPPPSLKVDKSLINAAKSLTPPPLSQDPSMFVPNAAQAMQFNLMLNALNAAATKSPHFPYNDYANMQRSMLLETLRQNVEKSSALLAMHHQIQQQHQQQNQKNPSSSHSPSSSASSPSSKH